MEIYMNNDELMQEIMKTINLNGETFEEMTNISNERADEIAKIAAEIENAIYESDEANPQQVYINTVPQMKTPGELLYLMQSFGLRMGRIVTLRNNTSLRLSAKT